MAHAILLFDGALTQAPRSGLVCQKQASYHRFTRLRSECSYFIVRVWTRFAIDRGTVSSTPFSAKMFVTDGSFRPRKCLTWLAFSQSYIYIFSLQSCTMGFAHLRPISYGKPVLRLKMEVSTPSQACLTYTIRFAHIRVNEAEWGICFKKPSCWVRFRPQVRTLKILLRYSRLKGAPAVLWGWYRWVILPLLEAQSCLLYTSDAADE